MLFRFQKDKSRAENMTGIFKLDCEPVSDRPLLAKATGFKVAHRLLRIRNRVKRRNGRIRVGDSQAFSTGIALLDKGSIFFLKIS